jgi:hypothetical protein
MRIKAFRMINLYGDGYNCLGLSLSRGKTHVEITLWMIWVNVRFSFKKKVPVPERMY